jgi:enoyl-CoA hydratase
VPKVTNTVLLSVENHVAVITLSRPDRLNAINSNLINEFGDAVNQIKRNQEIKAVIITGEGRAFCAGADISEFLEQSSVDAAYHFLKPLHNALNELESLAQPVIAAVNGYAFGGGCEITLACDLRIASDKAVFGQPEIKLGIFPGAGGSQRLPRLIGATRAKEMILFGEPINAEEANRIGLVNQVVPNDELLSTAKKWAQKLTEGPTIAIQNAKRVINQGLEIPLHHGLEMELQAFSMLFDTHDYREGCQAFLEKRQPTFKGE